MEYLAGPQAALSAMVRVYRGASESRGLWHQRFRVYAKLPGTLLEAGEAQLCASQPSH